MGRLLRISPPSQERAFFQGWLAITPSPAQAVSATNKASPATMSVNKALTGCHRVFHNDPLKKRNACVNNWLPMHVSLMTGFSSQKRNGVPSVIVSWVGNLCVGVGIAGTTSSRMPMLQKHLIQ